MRPGRVCRRRGGAWQIAFRYQGREVRESVARVLGVPPAEVTEADAQRALAARLAQIAAEPGAEPAPGSGLVPSERAVTRRSLESIIQLASAALARLDA